MPTDEEATVRDRLAKLAAEGRHAECEAVAWQWADHIMRGPVGLIHIGDSLSSARRGCAIQSSRRRKTNAARPQMSQVRRSTSDGDDAPSGQKSNGD